MKKRILALFAIVALLAVLVVPTAALADTTDVTGEVGATPVVTSLSPDNGNPGQTATLTTITGSGFEDTGDTLVTMEGPGLTITNSTYVNSTTITFDLAIAAGATATAGTRDVTVTQAGQSGTGVDKYTVNTVTTISAPGGFGLGYMSPTASPATGSSVDGSVTTNATSWVVTAKDVNATTADRGYMTKAVGEKLTAKFQISKDSVSSGLQDSDDPGLSYGTADGLTLKLYVSQAIAGGDIAGTYTITITYAVTVQ